MVNIQTTTSQGIDVGASISLGGVYKNPADLWTWGILKGGKENATDNNSAGYLSFWTNPAAGTFGERMRISSLGNIGIGTSAPIYKLHVEGGYMAIIGTVAGTSSQARLYYYDNIVPTVIWLTGLADQGTSYVVETSASAGVKLVYGASAWSAISDQTVKHIYGDTENNLEKLLNLRHVYYKFKPLNI